MSNDLSWNDAREARLDRAIDRAVREIMQIDPPPGLRRRVLSRLNAPTKRGTLPFGRYALAMTTLAAIALVVLLTPLFSRVDAPKPPQPPAMAVAAPIHAVDAEAVIQQTAARGQSGIPGQITRERIPMPHVTNVFGNRQAQMSAATVDGRKRDIVVRPLTIVPLSQRAIPIERLVIPQLSNGGRRE